MPIVRLYPESEVSPLPLPDAAPNVPAAGDIDLFGENQARDLQVAGQNLVQASDTLFALQQRYAQEANDTRVQDFNNQFITRVQQTLRTGPDAYARLEGAEAIRGAGAVTQQLAGFKDELLQQAPNDYQRRRLGPILEAHFESARDEIARHVGRQQQVYEQGVHRSAIEVAGREAISNPGNLGVATLRAADATRALYRGQPPEVVEAETRRAQSQVVSGLITDRLNRDDPAAVVLYRQHENRLDPSDRSALGAAVETLWNSIDAAAWLRERAATLSRQLPNLNRELSVDVKAPETLLEREGIVGTRERLEEIENRRKALTALNQQEFATNPARRRANQVGIDGDTARSRAAVKAEADALYADLRRHLTTGGPNGGPAVTPLPATITSRLTEEQQDAVSAKINRAIAGQQTWTDPQTFYAIHQGLTGEDAAARKRWAAKNLTPFMGQLSDNDLAALEKLQTADDAEQRRLQAITRIANDTLRHGGIDPTARPDAAPGSDAAQAARFNRLVHDELSAFESRGGKPTEAEAYGIVVGLKDIATKSGWLRVSDSRVSPAMDSDIPLTDDAIHEPGAELAQAGPQDDKTPTTRSGPAATEPDPGSDVYHAADRQARGVVAEQEIQEIENDRAVSSWMTGIRPDGPVPELSKDIAERLRPDQQEEIQEVIDAGAASRSDSETFKEIFLGLTSDDAGERLKWAREPLYSYRPQLSEKDYANLVLIQRNISARAGIPIEGVGYPLGTLDDHAKLAAALLAGGAGGSAVSAGQAAVWIARQAVRAGRWALEKIKGKDEPLPRKNDQTTSERVPDGGGGLAARAAETVLSIQEADTGEARKVITDQELPVPQIMERVSGQPGRIVREKLNPNDNELAAGEAFAALGHNVVHKKESLVKGKRSADLLVEGIGDVEVYSPRQATQVVNVLRAIEGKQWQAHSIIVQTELPVEAMQTIAARLWGKPNVVNVETLFFMAPNGTIRRFDKPRKPSK